MSAPVNGSDEPLVDLVGLVSFSPFTVAEGATDGEFDGVTVGEVDGVTVGDTDGPAGG